MQDYWWNKFTCEHLILRISYEGIIHFTTSWAVFPRLHTIRHSPAWCFCIHVLSQPMRGKVYKRKVKFKVYKTWWNLMILKNIRKQYQSAEKKGPNRTVTRVGCNNCNHYSNIGKEVTKHLVSRSDCFVYQLVVSTTWFCWIIFEDWKYNTIGV